VLTCADGPVSFPDTRPATNTFSWHKDCIPDGFPGITEKIIAIPAKRLGFPKIHLVQPVPWKMRLEMVIGMQNEILIGVMKLFF